MREANKLDIEIILSIELLIQINYRNYDSRIGNNSNGQQLENNHSINVIQNTQRRERNINNNNQDTQQTNDQNNANIEQSTLHPNEDMYVYLLENNNKEGFYLNPTHEKKILSDLKY